MTVLLEAIAFWPITIFLVSSLIGFIGYWLYQFIQIETLDKGDK